MSKHERYMASSEWDKQFESVKWMESIPHINFPEKWNVKIIPPFRSAVVRFHVDYRKAHVSVYLDCYEMIGTFGEPYWEVYPYDNDVFRCKMNDVESLLNAIKESFDEQNSKASK